MRMPGYISFTPFLFLLIILTACEQSEPAQAQQQIRSLKTITVTHLASAQTRNFSGVVQASDSTSLSFEVGGRVKAIRVKEGDRIKKGEILALLNKESYELDVTAAKADLEKAKSNYDNKLKDFERYQILVKKGVISKSQFDQSKFERDSTKNSVAYARAKLNLAQRDLKNTELRAPFNGFVANRNIDVHVEVSAGQHIFDMDAEGALEVLMAVPESIIGRLYQGATTHTRFPSAPTTVTEGRITEIGSSADTTNANAFAVITSLHNPLESLHPGMTAEVTILLKKDIETQGYLVPSTALMSQIDKPRKPIVFVYDSVSSTVHRREVNVAGVRENLVVINEGINAGEILAAAGLSFLSDGQKVKLLLDE